MNDEVNLAILDEEVTGRRDLAGSREISYEEWRKRLFLERFQKWMGGLLERQQ